MGGHVDKDVADDVIPRREREGYLRCSPLVVRGGWPEEVAAKMSGQLHKTADEGGYRAASVNVLGDKDFMVCEMALLEVEHLVCPTDEEEGQGESRGVTDAIEGTLGEAEVDHGVHRVHR
jgi:hypothetical protein